MAKQFKFNERLVVSFDIEGKIYKRPYNEKLMESIKKMQSVYATLKIETDEDIPEVEKKCSIMVDEILGAGAFKEIFDQRGYDVVDELDLVIYLIEELDDFYKEIQKKQVVQLDDAKKEQLEKVMESAVKAGENGEMGIIGRTAPYA